MGSAIPIQLKAKLRRQLRSQRRALSATRHAQLSAKAAKALMRLANFTAGKRVALYLPFDRELETAVLIEAARRRHVHVFVPVITDRRHGRLRFYPLRGKTRSGTFGISIPLLCATPVLPQWLDLIVIPLVGVDKGGSRLGMGGGFYDRALAYRRRRTLWKGPPLVGLAFDCQRTESDFVDSWDVRLDALATESGLEHFL